MTSNAVRASVRCTVIVAFAFLASVPALVAQQLTSALCPAGTNFQPRPFFTPYGGSGIPLLLRTIDTTVYPDAVCNDSSPAVMYIRPANAAFAGNPILLESSKWLIFLDGGGGCRDADACLYTRWCSGGNAIFDRAGKMSSLGAFAAISGTGIFSDNPVFNNQFVDYNVVLVHYCSSDNWIGSATYAALATTLGDTFDIRFEGEAIVNAVFSTLLAGPTVADGPVATEFYDTPLPDLSDATEILLGGESAGAGGLRHHLDRLHFDVLLPDVVDPEVDIRAVLDAGFTPGQWDPTIVWPNPPSSYADLLLTEVEPSARGFWSAEDSALDASCLDPAHTVAHNAVGSHPQICLDTTYTLLNHITTPVFSRMDINDLVGKDPYVTWALYPNADAYWTAQFNQLVDFSNYMAGVGGIEGPLAAPGLQGPKCDLHVAIQNNHGFFRHRVVGPGVPARSFHDLLLNWVGGVATGPDTVQIQTDNLGAGLYSSSFCP